MCFKAFYLHISCVCFISDPQEWTRDQVRSWLQFTMKQFEITSNEDMKNIFDEDGRELSRLNEIDFISRIPQV